METTTSTIPDYINVARAQICDTLNKAADLIETNGWHQGGYYPGWNDTLDAPNWRQAGEVINEQGLACCVLGAIAACGGGQREADVLAEVVRGEPDVWNDHPARTQSEVVAALREAAQS